MHKFFAKTLFVGKKVYFLPECHSTNEEAQLLLKREDIQEGTVVISSKQLKGRGQRGNEWESEPNKNLTCSVVLRPKFLQASEQFDLNIITSLAIVKTLRPILGTETKIKWPNDIYVRDKKIAGILIENSLRGVSIEHSVIGIGLNVNQIKFNYPIATSLANVTNQEHDIFNLAETILQNLENSYLKMKSLKKNELSQEYHSLLYKRNLTSLFKDSGGIFSGRITKVNQSGQLLIQTDEGSKAFDFKEVEFLNV